METDAAAMLFSCAFTIPVEFYGCPKSIYVKGVVSIVMSEPRYCECKDGSCLIFMHGLESISFIAEEVDVR